MSASNQFIKLHRMAINTITNILNEGSTMDDYPTWFVWIMTFMLFIAILLQPFAAAVRTAGQYLMHSKGVFSIGISYLLGTAIGLLVLYFNFKGFLLLYAFLWGLKLFSLHKHGIS